MHLQVLPRDQAEWRFRAALVDRHAPLPLILQVEGPLRDAGGRVVRIRGGLAAGSVYEGAGDEVNAGVVLQHAAVWRRLLRRLRRGSRTVALRMEA